MTDPIREILAANMKRYRQTLGYSQMHLAERADISTSLVASIETGTKFPSSATLSKLCSAFNLDVHQLFLPEGHEDANLKRYLKHGELRQQLQDEISAIIDSRFEDFLTKRT